MMQARSVDVQPLDSHRFRLGEGGRWDGTDFWQVDLLDGDLWRSAGGTAELHRVLDLDLPLGAMAPTTGGGHVVIAGTGFAAVGDAGTLDWFDRPVDGRQPPRRVNDAAVSGGRMFFGTMDFPGEIGNGDLWRADPDRTVTHLLGGLGCPNGPAVSPDGRTLYLADSSAFVIRRYPLAVDGSLGAGTDFVTLDEDFGKPDGMTVDDDGHLWVAIWGGAAVARFDPEGGWADLISVPVRQPTSVTILPGRMLVTSAFNGLTDPGELDGATLVLPCDVSAPVTAAFGAG
jgi:sugar lactone lactonase YvrE